MDPRVKPAYDAVERDQVEEYAARKGCSVAEAERWLRRC
jgi:hypothetical protein